MANDLGVSKHFSVPYTEGNQAFRASTLAQPGRQISVTRHYHCDLSGKGNTILAIRFALVNL
jgi:hypothetical protein